MDVKGFEKRVLSLASLGKTEEALLEIDNASEAKFPKWVISNLKGIVYRHQGNVQEAYDALKDAADHADEKMRYIPSLNLAVLLNSQNRFRDALPYAQAAYDAKPDANSALVLVSALLDSAKIEPSLKVLDSLKQNEKDKPEFKLARASCLRHTGDFMQAISLIEDVLKQNPEHSTAARMFADITGEVGTLNPLPIYDRALSLAAKSNKSNLHPIKWNMSLHLLRRREFRKGLEFYESGLYVGTMGRNIPEPFLRMKRADEAIINPSLWTYAVVEQGIGDQILFLSCLNELLAECNDKIILIAEERMHDILKRSFPAVQVAFPGLIEHLPFSKFPSNGFVPIGSLFKKYRKSKESFIDHRKPYIVVNREKYQKYRSILKSEAKARPIVGLSWKGGFWENQVRNKAIELSQWQPLLERDAFFVNLQYGDVRRDLEWANLQGFSIRSFPELDYKVDLDDWLALGCACDGVISVSTALVHFVGAANQKVAVLMPEQTGPWYLGIQEPRSMVYPNVFHFWKGEQERSESFFARVGDIIK